MEGAMGALWVSVAFSCACVCVGGLAPVFSGSVGSLLLCLLLRWLDMMMMVFLGVVSGGLMKGLL